MPFGGYLPVGLGKTALSEDNNMSHEIDEYPKIRNVEPLPVIVRDEQLIALRDPHDLNGKGHLIVMSQQAFMIATLFTGSNSVTDIQTYLTRMCGGVLFPREELVKLVTMLDENLLLESSQRYQDTLKTYHEQSMRKAVLPGRSLPASREDLETFLNDCITQAALPLPTSEVRAFIVPHIDMARGIKCYAEAYHAVATNQDADIFVIFGTSHYADPSVRFAFTRKEFETPFGMMPVAQEFVDSVVKKTSQDLFAAEIVHKGEHSIEFQVLCLQHTIARKRPVRIVPILVGPFLDCIETGSSPRQTAEIREVIDAIKATASEIGEQKICWIASVDLSHVGLRFGDSEAPDERLLENIRQRDSECLTQAMQCAPEGFFQKLSQNNNCYHICGGAPIYTFLAMLEGKQLAGSLLKYEQSPEAETQSVVTFATMTFTR